MTDKINNGGPAFPQNDLSGYGMGPAGYGNGGMSLRDWFAGQVLAGANKGMLTEGDVQWIEQHGAENAY